jgi:3-deoxy-7-phosphoheptulonate synthase
MLLSADAPSSSPDPSWTPSSWRGRAEAHAITYEDREELDRVLARLSTLPPLVTSWEIERLKSQLAEAQQGKRFLLQGGDCAEMLDDCDGAVITRKIKILLQMSLVLLQASGKPVIRVGRLAGQYAKPRSNPVETRDGESLPSYFGDLINGAEFDAASRRPDPERLLRGYAHSAMTLNFVRSLSAAGFADLHHPEYWDLGFFNRADLSPEVRADYERVTTEVSRAMRFMEALGEDSVEKLSRVEFFTSHEGLSLNYEEALTRQVPRRQSRYALSCHLPWIGERTRALDGAHVELFRGVGNPVGVKVGPSADPSEIVELVGRLNPMNLPGKTILVSRVGAKRVKEVLPRLVEGVKRAGKRVLWVCDPMHGNTVSAKSGLKTRNFEDILAEVEACFDVHEELGTVLGGVHFELTGEDVTECTGRGVDESLLDKRYASRCDPRLNYTQAMEMAFAVGRRMAKGRAVHGA